MPDFEEGKAARDMMRAGLLVNILAWGVIIAVSAATLRWFGWRAGPGAGPGGGRTMAAQIVARRAPSWCG